jgi:beta-galactosidase
VYSNCADVELFINGKSLGSKPLPEDASPRIWQVPFEGGTLRAAGSNGGKIVAEQELRTAGKPAKVLLSADRSRLTRDWDDVAYITATVVDENGVQIPRATNLIRFRTNAAGKVIAVDNADNASHESFQALQRSAYGGRAIAIVRAIAGTGPLIVHGAADGLADSEVIIQVEKETQYEFR